jgi:hypothetical protein
MRKAQAAMEFLMTYGWAILVVLAAIGALAYFGVLSPGNLLPQKCEFTSGFDCTETPSADGGAGGADAGIITIALTNSNGYDIKYLAEAGPPLIAVASVSSLNYGCDTIAIDPVITPNIWKNGEAAILTIGGCTFAGLGTGDRYKETITITVTSAATGLVHTVVGTVAGKLA